MLLSVHIIPNASRSEIVGWHEGALKIRLAAAPIEGRANEELCRFLGKVFDVAPSLIEIERGSSSKKKRILLPITEEDARVVLSNY